MDEIKQLLKDLITVPGLSGYEEPVRELIKAVWEPLTDELSTSKLGNLYGLSKGTGGTPRKSILIATHMDAIGLIVTRVEDSFIRVAEIGGIDHRILPGQMVTIHSRGGDLPGMVIQPPAHTLPEDAQSGPVPLKYLWVDTGLSSSMTTKQVMIGDLVSFATEPIEFDGDYICGHSFDNRASVVALTETLKLLGKRRIEWDVWAVATVSEEVTMGGAMTSGFQLRPSLGVVIDVTYGKSPGSPEHLTYEMNKGPTLDWGPNTHLKLYNVFEDLAKQLEIPFQRAVYQRSSGTDAYFLQLAAEGIPTMILSIPLRYMHTPVEMLQIKDITRTARLLVEFITMLDDEFMGKLSWEEMNE
ncbi:MAG: M20/M25/M40 family metallo-hydrolase [Anaerolineales bacterium]|jgi:endoglucanase